MEFWEVLSENWFEILSAVGTIAAIFLTRNGKKTAAERQEMKIKKAEAKLNKDLSKAKEDAIKLEELKKGDNTQ